MPILFAVYHFIVLNLKFNSAVTMTYTIMLLWGIQVDGMVEPD